MFEGVSGNIVMDPLTGSRLSSSAFYTLTNYVEEERIDSQTGKVMVEFKEITSDQFADGVWTPIVPYLYNDGTIYPPSGIPIPIVDTNFINPWVRAIACILCASGIIASIGFAFWTWKNRSERVVLASQPFFLFLI